MMMMMDKGIRRRLLARWLAGSLILATQL